jgi:hypothetical protein
VGAQTGEVKWKYESDNFINGAPACSDGKTFFGGCDGFLHVVDIVSGKADKKIDVATYVPGSPAVENKKAYLGDYDGRFFQVDIEKRKPVGPGRTKAQHCRLLHHRLFWATGCLPLTTINFCMLSTKTAEKKCGNTTPETGWKHRR